MPGVQTGVDYGCGDDGSLIEMSGLFIYYNFVLMFGLLTVSMHTYGMDGSSLG